jgi:methylmalonyl-CoA mutase cobalamin-binding subunit
MGGKGPIVVVTTPLSQHHELGAFMVKITAETGGWHAIYLGSNIPAEEIAFAALEKNARAVALSLTYPADDPRLPDELRKLRKRLPDNVALLVGGAAALGYREVLEEIKARRAQDLKDLRLEFNRLRKAP